METYKVNAFCKDIFSGNPSAVCLIADWPEDELMQNIAGENNLAGYSFLRQRNGIIMFAQRFPMWRTAK